MLLIPVTLIRAQSAADGFDPGADGNIVAIAFQADGKIVVGGYFTMIGGGGTGHFSRNHIARLNPDGTIDSSFNPGANDAVTALAVQADGKILVGGLFTVLGDPTGTIVRGRIGRLNADGSLDMSFNPGANDAVNALAIQSDGKILVGGNFTTLGGGGAGTTTVNRIGRLNLDGTLDATFNSYANGPVNAFALQPDGKIVAGGDFTALGDGSVGAPPSNHIGRLNPNGTRDTAFHLDANNIVYALAAQPDGKVVAGGEFTALANGNGDITRNHIARVNSDGTVENGFSPGANGAVYSIVLQRNGKILLGGAFTLLGGGSVGMNTRNRVGRLNFDGTIDSGFNPGADNLVFAVGLQGDDKIVLGGLFGSLGGGAADTQRRAIGRVYPDGSLERNFIASINTEALALQPDGRILVGQSTAPNIRRLNSDGTIDMSFDPGADGQVISLVVEEDGKILAGGSFSKLGGGGTGTTTRQRIGRINSNGSLDANFDPGANEFVYAIVPQADGRILVGGSFTMIGGGGTGSTPRNYIARLNQDGTVDPAFNPGTNGPVVTIQVQNDGKILVGGNFSKAGGGTGTVARNNIARLNPDGTLDTGFDPGTNGIVYNLLTQVDGKILVAGVFTTIGGGDTGSTQRYHIARLNPNGSVDTAFDPGANQSIIALALQADGKILLGGNFTKIGGGGTGSTMRNYIARLDPAGAVDNTFDPGANGQVSSIALQTDGKVLAGGNFTMIGGGGTGTTFHQGLARLTNPVAASHDLAFASGGTAITWRSLGSAPEVARASFELSTDGVTYTKLAEPTRVNGSWQLAGQALPTQQNIFVRARGFYATGELTSSGSIAETVQNAYLLPAGMVSNVSTRLPVGTGDNVLIEGFIVQGSVGSTKKIIVRAIGPSLVPFGISDALANPTLEIHDSSGATVATNNDWKTTQPGGLITGDQAAEINATGVAPGNDLESAIIANLAPGSYTAVVRGVANTTGTGVVDAFDLSPASPARLANISTRGLVQPGDKLMIAGFIIQNAPVKLVVRATGPSLTAFGVTNALPDTTLQLRDANGVIVLENDDWKTNQRLELENTGLQPSDDREAALVTTIQPGQYTAQVRGKPEATGTGVVEVYFLP